MIFPHHENEIAQSECCTGKEFARYWMHNGYINIDNRKMSKSLGNFFTVREVSEKYGYEPIRYLMISAHYRSPINFSAEVIEQCVSSLERLYNCRDNLVRAIEHADGDGNELVVLCDAKKAKFIDAMEDDLNTADAISAVFEMVRDINSARAQSADTLKYALNMFDELCDILGILYSKREKSAIPDSVSELAKERDTARKERNFKRADEIRNELQEMGYIVEDTPNGTVVKEA